jgi:hypothetical protein
VITYLKDCAKAKLQSKFYQLKSWREVGPEAPDAPWYKDFGSFKVCGEGKYPKTFLLRGQPAKGEKL